MRARDEQPETVPSKDGTPIAVWRSGNGPPLLLVHGAAADHSRWAPVLPALEEPFTVLAVDRRGRGGSGDAHDYAIEREFEDVAAVVEWAGEQTDVLGHSHGGLCALESALLTDGIRRLVLYEPPMGFLASPPHVVHRLQALLDADERDALLAYFMQEVPAFLPSRSSCCARCRPGRRGWRWPTRFPGRSGPAGSTGSIQTGFEPSTCRRCCSRAATARAPSGRRARRCRRRSGTVGPS